MWLEFELQVQEDSTRFYPQMSKPMPIHKRGHQRDTRQLTKATSIFLGTEKYSSDMPTKAPDPKPREKKMFCPYCDAQDHYLNVCASFQRLNRDQKVHWIQSHKRCWRCGRAHQAAQCNLKTPCKSCNRRHLYILHEVNDQSFMKTPETPKVGHSESFLVNTTTETLYLDRPFGTSCSPCCATFAIQKHVIDHSLPGEDVRESIEKYFYVDNFLQSFSCQEEARARASNLRDLLATGGFDLRQWASNAPQVLDSIPSEAKSSNLVLWLTQEQPDAQESALGLLWHCTSDTLSYKYRPIECSAPTMRHIYKVLASQYDPLGYIVPYTTRAKVLVQRLWDKKREWDDPQLPDELLQAWQTWEQELPDIQRISIPRSYITLELDNPQSIRNLHIFCDASERAYGSVAYIQTLSHQGDIEIAFVTARSRVSPKKQQSIPRLELCAALTGAQLAKVLKSELSVPIRQVTLWSDSTTVLAWIQADSCRYKVFVGTRVAEIQELTDPKDWRYVDSKSNPADDITRGKTLSELAKASRWSQGPSFLLLPADQWPQIPLLQLPTEDAELKQVTFYGLTVTVNNPALPDCNQFGSYKELLAATARALHGVATPTEVLTAEDYVEAELALLHPTEIAHLKSGKPLPMSSCLLCLAPEYDITTNLIRVGGHLRRTEQLDESTIHPIVLDPKHPLSRLIIQDFDEILHHPGAERFFAEVRRKYWILRGREAIRQHQRTCLGCKQWRGQPSIPRMADLPPSRLRLFQPAFYSTGVDCFGPYLIKIGRRHEKRWGIIFKCLTTRAVYLDLLYQMDSD